MFTLPSEFLAARLATELVVFQIGIAHTDLGLQPPTPTQNPMVTITDAAADQPTFVTMVQNVVVFDRTEHLAAPESPRQQTSHIVLCVMGMNTPETAAETRARPKTELRLHEPMLHLAVVGKCPRIVIARKIERGVTTQTDLRPQIDGRSRVVQQIRLDSPDGA